MKLTISEKRKITLGTLRWINRQAPRILSWDEMRFAFDDMCRTQPDTIAAWFWANASPRQISILEKEYKTYYKL